MVAVKGCCWRSKVVGLDKNNPKIMSQIDTINVGMSQEELLEEFVKIQEMHANVLHQMNQINAEAATISNSIQSKVKEIEDTVEKLTFSVKQIQVGITRSDIL